MSELKELIELIKVGTQAYDSYATSQLATANVAAGRRHQDKMLVKKDELATQRYEQQLTDTLLRDEFQEAEQDLDFLQNKADVLDIDWQSYITEIDEDSRTDDMKGIYDKEEDYQINSLKRAVELTGNIAQDREQLRGALDVNEWMITNLSDVIREHKAGLRDAEKIDAMAAGDMLLKYNDYVNKVREDEPKYVMSTEDLIDYQENVLGMVKGDVGYGEFGALTQEDYLGGTYTDPGVDKILGTQDDIERPLTARGTALMGTAPSTKDVLAYQKLAGDDKRASKIEKAYAASNTQRWENIDQNARERTKTISALKANKDKDAYSSPYDIGSILKDKGQINNLQDINNLQTTLIANIHDMWESSGSKSSDFNTIAESSRAGNDRGALNALYTMLTQEGDIDSITGMNKKYLDSFDGEWFGKDFGTASQIELIQNLTLWKELEDSRIVEEKEHAIGLALKLETDLGLKETIMSGTYSTDELSDLMDTLNEIAATDDDIGVIYEDDKLDYQDLYKLLSSNTWQNALANIE